MGSFGQTRKQIVISLLSAILDILGFTLLKCFFLILSLSNFFGSSLRELGISFHSLATILGKTLLCIFIASLEAFM